MSCTVAGAANLRDLAWDGQTFRADVGIDSAVQLHVDGQLFARWPAQAAGERAIHFMFVPSGQAVMQLQVCSNGMGLHAPVQVRWGEPGHGDTQTTATPLRALSGADHAWLADAATLTQLAPQPVTVIVPIHNASPAFARALQALQQHTQLDASLLLIDDASTDPAIAGLLEQAATWPRVRVLRNVQNLGFTATVNRGLQHTLGDVVLLNADTEVGPGWLGALRAAAYAGADVASATAVSNNAGAFSVPELEQANAVPDGWSYADAARALRQSSGLIQPQLPTGNGFCLFIRAAALAQVGALDAQAFAQGYGEENDWCQRACTMGWRHVIAGNVYVAHARSQSFGDARRAALGAQGMAVLRQRYPQYETEVGAQLFSFERLALDWRVRQLWAQAVGHAPPSPRMLVLGACRTYGIESENATARGQIFDDSPADSGSIGQESAEIWTVQTDLQPILHKSDRLLDDRDDDACPGWALWRVRVAAGRIDCMDADGQVQDSASADRFDQVLPRWLQRHGIEALCCASTELTRYATICAALGVACLDARGVKPHQAPRGGTFQA